MVLECCENNMTSLLPAEIKCKNGPYVQELLDAILLLAGLALKIPRYSTFDSLEAKENHIVDTFMRNAAFKGTNSI